MATKSIKSKRGGKRPNSGRKPGVPNKSTFELKKAASVYGEETLNKLVSIVRNEETPLNVAVAACKEILDRGFGRPAITIDAPEINLNVFPPKEELDALYEKALVEAAEMEAKLSGRRERLGIIINHGDFD
jgi:hypothetical protein